MSALWIFLGGGLGSVARWWATGLVDRYGQAFTWGPFPWGTLLVNVTGSFVIGIFATLTAPEGRMLAPASVREFVMIGMCGGYTTFSSFSLQTLLLVQDGQWAKAGLNSVLSLLLCLVGVWLGHVCGASLNTLKG